MKKTLILLSIYLVSAFVTWKYMKIAHSKEGRWSYINTGISELLITITPLINSYFFFIWIFFPPKKNKYKANFDDFFKVNK